MENLSLVENEDGEEIDEEVTFKLDLDESLMTTSELDTPCSEKSKSLCLSFEVEDESIDMDPVPVEKLNAYLASRDISPVRHTLTIPWEVASERTKRHYVRKGREVVHTCLEEIAPGESAALLDCLVKDQRTSTTDYALVEALCECYHNSSHWSTRRQILSIIADKMSFKELQEWIPDLTRYRFNIARHHTLLHGRGAVLPTERNTRMHIDPGKLDHFITFITSTHIVQDLPFGERILTLSSGEQIRIPNVVRTLIPEQVVRQYQGYCKDTGFEPASRRTLCRILSVCSASVRKSLQGLDYFSATGATAFDDLEEVVEKLGDEYGRGLKWAKETTEKLKKAKRYLKSDYKVHVSTTSTVADHCRAYALSDPADPDYKKACDHEHTVKCDRCDIFPSVLREIRSVFKDVKCPVEEREEIEYIIDQSVKNIESWKAHLLRSINQDSARHEILERIDDNSILLVSDWAMKYLPRKYRESQRDWFGKRGIPWHITVAIKKGSANNDIQMLTIVHIFEKCTQDGPAVVAIFDDVLKQLKTVLPDLSTIYMKQDNAGCYHSALTMLAVHQIAKNNGVQLGSLDFSDPQGGKGSCDRKAATIKNHMKRYLYSGHDVETPDQMKTAMESFGGIPGVRVAVCFPLISDDVTPCKLDGVSYINNIEYSEDGITTWKAYKIGKGKEMSWKDLSLPTTLPHLDKKHQEHAEISFVSVKPRKSSSESEETEETEDESSENEDQDIESEDYERSSGDEKLFFCPEEGCTKSFQRYSSFEKHLECERHKYALENMTLYDKCMVHYAAKLEEGTSKVTAVDPQDMQHVSSDTSVTGSAVPSMGWALKTGAKKQRFTDTQRKYLIDVFMNGEVTGQKANPAEVSKAMRKAKKPDGTRMFHKDLFLTPQQISSFFSRQSKKKVLFSNKVAQNEDDDNEEDEYEEEVDTTEEQDNWKLTDEVISAIALQHPVLYGSYNICELSTTYKLAEFSISMLKEMCAALALDTSHIKVRRKKPYLELIKDVVDQCGCSR